DFDRDLNGGEPPQVQVIYDGGEAPLAGNAEAFIWSLLARSGASLAPRLAPPVAPPAAAPPGGVEVVTRALFNPRLEGKPFMVAGTFGFVLTFLTTIITAVSIVNERLTGTFDQLQVTPATSGEILLGKLLPLGAVFALDVVLMMLVAGFVLGVWPQGNALLFIAIFSGYVFFSLALGLYF